MDLFETNSVVKCLNVPFETFSRNSKKPHNEIYLKARLVAEKLNKILIRVQYVLKFLGKVD